MSQYQEGKTNLDFSEARDSEWQCHQLGHMQVCTFLQTDNHASTPPLSFLQAGCPSCRPTNSIKALKAPSTRTDPVYCHRQAGTERSDLAPCHPLSSVVGQYVQGGGQFYFQIWRQTARSFINRAPAVGRHANFPASGRHRR